MNQKSQLTTLCYIKKDDCYLMLHRVKKENDINRDKWIGVGGHFEKGESPEDCLLREVKEETGLTLNSWNFRGIITFDYDDEPAEYMCLYTSEDFSGELKVCDEGDLQWVPIEKFSSLDLWEGDLIFLDLIKNKDQKFFSLKLNYKKGQLEKAVLDGKEIKKTNYCQAACSVPRLH